MEFLNKETVKKQRMKRIREYLTSKLEKYEGEPIKLDVDNLEKVLFCESTNGKRFAIDRKIARKIDMSDVCFDGMNVCGFNFTGFKGVKINPNRVYERKFSDTNLAGVEFTEEFNNCSLNDVSFAGSKGALINPSKNTILRSNVFTDVRFMGAITSADITYCNFAGSKNAVISLNVPGVQQSINVLYGATLTDATIVGSFDGCSIRGVNFKGAKNENGENIRINLNKLASSDLSNCVFDGVEFTEPSKRFTIMTGADFTGSKGFNIRTHLLTEGSLNHAKLSGVTFDCTAIGGIRLEKIVGADFTGSKGACIWSVFNEKDPVLDIKRTELVNCNLTDAYFPESYSLEYILRSFRSLDTCTYKGIGFDEAVKTYQNEERETLGKVYTKIDNAIKKAE